MHRLLIKNSNDILFKIVHFDGYLTTGDVVCKICGYTLKGTKLYGYGTVPFRCPKCEFFYHYSLALYQHPDWKFYTGYEGLYLVSPQGQIYSMPKLKYGRGKKGLSFSKGHLMIPNVSHSGYLKNVLSKSGKTSTVAVHRMVAKEFVNNPNPNKLNSVNHKNENKLDNSYNNLEWCSVRYNDNYGTRNKRMRENKRTLGNILATTGDVHILYPSIHDFCNSTGGNSSWAYECLKTGNKCKGYLLSEA